MKEYLKYIALIIACATTLWIMAQIKSCSNRSDKEEITVVTPQDSSFVPVFKSNLRPRSTPFEQPVKASGRLPKGITEANVARIVRVIKRIPVDTIGNVVNDTTNIILTKDGQLYVQKQDGISTEVFDTNIIPPIFSFEFNIGVGASFTKDTFAPGIGVCPLTILGRVQFPFATIDGDGVGIGANYKIGNITTGIIKHWKFEDTTESLRVTVHYFL